jgi:hypothetical protein
MVITRYLRYAFLGLLAAFAVPFASALERPMSYLTSAVEDMQSPAMVRHQLTLAKWRSEHGVGAGLSTAGMRSESNHFVLSAILPAVVLTT